MKPGLPVSHRDGFVFVTLSLILICFQLLPQDVSIVEENKKELQEAKQIARKLVMVVVPSEKSEDKDKEKEEEKNDKVRPPPHPQGVGECRP